MAQSNRAQCIEHCPNIASCDRFLAETNSEIWTLSHEGPEYELDDGKLVDIGEVINSSALALNRQAVDAISSVREEVLDACDDGPMSLGHVQQYLCRSALKAATTEIREAYPDAQSPTNPLGTVELS